MLNDIASYVAHNFGVLPVYADGIIRRPSYRDNGKGTMAKSPIEAPCKVQIDDLSQDQLSEGFSESSVRLIILLDGLDQFLSAGNKIQDDDEIEIPGRNETYRLSGPKSDPLNTHVTARGRLKPNSA